MVSPVEGFKDIISNAFEEIIVDEDNQQALATGAQWIARAIRQDRIIYIAGIGGHANICAEECLFRTGMLVPLSPMLDVTNLMDGTKKAKKQKTAAGYAAESLRRYGVKQEDVMIVINAYSISYLTVDFALEARKAGLNVIGIGSKAFAKNAILDNESCHSSRAKLYEAVDVYIDCKMAPEDAAVSIAGCAQKLGPTSTLCQMFALHVLMIKAAEVLSSHGKEIPVWRSINIPGGREYNKEYLQQYGTRIKFLL